jgi:hypothetical protein
MLTVLYVELGKKESCPHGVCLPFHKLRDAHTTSVSPFSMMRDTHSYHVPHFHLRRHSLQV